MSGLCSDAPATPTGLQEVNHVRHSACNHSANQCQSCERFPFRGLAGAHRDLLRAIRGSFREPSEAHQRPSEALQRPSEAKAIREAIKGPSKGVPVPDLHAVRGFC